jgi:hypothetical protein
MHDALVARRFLLPEWTVIEFPARIFSEFPAFRTQFDPCAMQVMAVESNHFLDGAPLSGDSRLEHVFRK